MKTHFTSIVFVFRQQTLPLQQVHQQPEFTTSYDHIADLQLKNRILCASTLTYLLMLLHRLLLNAYQHV